MATSTTAAGEDASQRRALVAMVEHDLLASWRAGGWLSFRVLVQPALFVFVFAYVFPSVGQSVGGASGATYFSTLLVAGTVSSTAFAHALQAVALPLVRDLGFTREIEDRANAPFSDRTIAASKVLAGATEGFIAGILVAPVALAVPAQVPSIHVDPITVLVVFATALLGSSLGFFVGCTIKVDKVPLLFGLLIVPLLFLGATYYPWRALHTVRWLQVVVLVNPLLYANELLRWAATSSSTPSMPPLLSGSVLILLSTGAFFAGVRKLTHRMRRD